MAVLYLEFSLPIEDWAEWVSDLWPLRNLTGFWLDTTTWWISAFIILAMNAPIAVFFAWVFLRLPLSLRTELGRRFLISSPYLWLLVLFLVPFVIVLKISFSDIALAIPPYTPNLKDGFWAMLAGLDLENYAFIGAGAVVAGVLALGLCIAMFSLVYPRVRRMMTRGDRPDTTLGAAIAGLTALAVSVVNVAIVLALASLLFPALERFVEIPDFLYFAAYLSSLKIAIVSTFLTLLIGYPIAYAMARSADHWRPTLLMLVILPFWTSFLIRVYAWIGILSTEGYLNQLLMSVGLISEPLTILNTPAAVYVGIVYTYLPFMVLPIFAALDKMDDSLVEAAEDLGCTALSAFWLVTAPLSKPGIIAGCFLVFIPALGEFVIPSLLGGSDTVMIGKVLWEEFFNNRDWPVASAVAVILLLILIIPIVLFQRNEQKQREAEG